MAKATKKETVTVTLELTEDEATVVYDVLGRVSGSVDMSRRGLTGEVRGALHRAGVRYLPAREADITGTVHFRDEVDDD